MPQNTKNMFSRRKAAEPTCDMKMALGRFTYELVSEMERRGNAKAARCVQFQIQLLKAVLLGKGKNCFHISSLPRKRLLIGRQYPLTEYQPIDKEQYTEKASCRPFRAKKGNSVHIPAAKKAAQDTEVQRIEQQKSDRYVVKHCAE